MTTKARLTIYYQHPLADRLKKFLAGGAIATAAHWSVLWLLILLHMAAVPANAIGALVGALVNYLLQYHITFRSAQNHSSTATRYTASCAISWLANNAIFAALVEDLDASVLIAQVVATGAVTALNFVLYQYLVFHEK